MSVVEEIGGVQDAVLAPIGRVAGRKKAAATATAMGAQNSFDLDFDRLRDRGLYHPHLEDAPLALEMRAIKRRLLRRLGYLRAAGYRSAVRSSGRQKNLVLMTSTQAGEGKTFNAVNLALSLAIEDQIETLLIDADAPRPRLRSIFALPDGPGLCDLLVDPSTPASTACWRAAQAPLTVLPVGTIGGGFGQKSADLFTEASTADVFAAISTAAPNRLVIIDAPPALAAPDAVHLAKHVDEVVFVVEANHTPEPAVASALDELLDVNPNISLILNRCVIGAGGAQYRSYESYGNQAYGGAV